MDSINITKDMRNKQSTIKINGIWWNNNPGEMARDKLESWLIENNLHTGTEITLVDGRNGSFRHSRAITDPMNQMPLLRNIKIRYNRIIKNGYGFGDYYEHRLTVVNGSSLN